MADILLKQKFDGSDYCSAVVEAIGHIITSDSKDKIDFREIFYPVSIAGGSYAIKSYNEVMAYASASKSAQTSRERIISTRNSIHAALSRHNLSYGKTDTPEDYFESYYLRRQRIDEITKKLRKRGFRNVDSAGGTDEDSKEGKKDATELKPLDNSEQKNEVNSAEPEVDEVADLRDSSVLFDDGDSSLAEHLIFEHKDESRTLLLASAGHGKTTLLKRIMLYYSQKSCGCLKNDDYDSAFVSKYHIPDVDYIPFLVKLREVSAAEHNFVIDSLIVESVVSFMRSKAEYAEIASASFEEDIRHWLSSLKKEKKTLLILIDGLDEISDKNKKVFLSNLENYLESNSDVRIVLSTRVAGIKTKKILGSFTRMGFSYRSILPLTQDDVVRYAHNWIEKTQKPEAWDRYKNSLAQIFENAKFLFLKNSMRSPLDAMIILRQIVSNSLSLSRYNIFRDMLWEYLTRHEEYEHKNPVYEDKMTLLSFVAYKMQMNDTLFASEDDIKEFFRTGEGFNFHTDIIKKDDIARSTIDFLNDLANNAGVVETQRLSREGGVGVQTKFTFPIRAFQEFLCAYACCHLKLTGERVPEPVKILESYIHDKKWSDIISFALSDLKSNNQQKYDSLVSSLIENLYPKDDELIFLKNLLETEMVINKEQAQAMCEKYFSGISLSKDKRFILETCLEYESAYAIIYHLRSKCRQVWDSTKNTAQDKTDDADNYFEAFARANILWCLKTESSVIDEAEKLLRSNHGYLNKAGALMLVLLTEMVLEDNDIRYNALFEKEKSIPDGLCELIRERYAAEKDVVFIQALSYVWVSKLEGSSLAGEILSQSVSYAKTVRTVLEKNATQLGVFCLQKLNMDSNENFLYFKRLVYTLGNMPHTPKARILWKGSNSADAIQVKEFLKTMYITYKQNEAYDILSLIFAQMWYGGIYNSDEFAAELKSIIDVERDILFVRSSKKSSVKTGPLAEKRVNHVFDVAYLKYKDDGLFNSGAYWQEVVETVYSSIKQAKFASDAQAAESYREILDYCDSSLEGSGLRKESLITMLKGFAALSYAMSAGKTASISENADTGCKEIAGSVKADCGKIDPFESLILGISGGSEQTKLMASFIQFCYYYCVKGDESKARTVLVRGGYYKNKDSISHANSTSRLLEKIVLSLESKSEVQEVGSSYASLLDSLVSSHSVNTESMSTQIAEKIESVFAGLDESQMRFIELLFTKEQFEIIKKTAIKLLSDDIAQS